MTRQNQPAHVARLKTTAPDAERVRLIREWHRAQAQSEQTPVAFLGLTITDCGQVQISGLAIEPEHALIFLGEIDAITERLRSYIESRRAHMPAPAAVMRLGRCA
jgi:hypothetical protein